MKLTVEQMNKHVSKIAELRIEEEKLSQAKKALSEELATAEAQMITYLKEENMESFNSPFGKVCITHRTSVKTPKTPEEKTLLTEYLRAGGLSKKEDLYDSVYGPNSQKLNSLFKSEIEEAKSLGLPDYSMPGCNEVTVIENLSFKRG